jgi:hypothetical protein
MLDSQSVLYVFLALVICYFLFGKRYRYHLINKYNYDFIGIPTFIAIAGPVIHTLREWVTPSDQYRNPENYRFDSYEAYQEALNAGLITPDPGTLEIITQLLLFATPGVIIATIVCLAKTRNLGIAVLNIPLIYLIAVAGGGAVTVVVMTVIVLILLKAFASRASSIVRGVSGAGTCPGCGAELS